MSDYDDAAAAAFYADPENRICDWRIGRWNSTNRLSEHVPIRLAPAMLIRREACC